MVLRVGVMESTDVDVTTCGVVAVVVPVVLGVVVVVVGGGAAVVEVSVVVDVVSVVVEVEVDSEVVVVEVVGGSGVVVVEVLVVVVVVTGGSVVETDVLENGEFASHFDRSDLHARRLSCKSIQGQFGPFFAQRPENSLVDDISRCGR
jgi:hypothetical protein